MNKRSFDFWQDEVERFVILETGREIVQPRRLEELLEEGRGHGQHHLVGGDEAVLALDVNVNIPLQI